MLVVKENQFHLNDEDKQHHPPYLPCTAETQLSFIPWSHVPGKWQLRTETVVEDDVHSALRLTRTPFAVHVGPVPLPYKRSSDVEVSQAPWARVAAQGAWALIGAYSTSFLHFGSKSFFGRGHCFFWSWK